MKPNYQKCLCVSLLLVSVSDGFFFEYPKKALLEFFHSLKAKKEGKKTNVYHYHHHHYPPPIHLVSARTVKAPEKRDLDNFHVEKLRTLGWGDHGYRLIPEPEIEFPTALDEPWDDYHRNPWEDEIFDTERSGSSTGLVVEFPLQQQIIIEHPAKAEPKGTNFLSTILQKLSRIKRSLFPPPHEGVDQTERRSINKLDKYPNGG